MERRYIKGAARLPNIASAQSPVWVVRFGFTNGEFTLTNNLRLNNQTDSSHSGWIAGNAVLNSTGASAIRPQLKLLSVGLPRNRHTDIARRILANYFPGNHRVAAAYEEAE